MHHIPPPLRTDNAVLLVIDMQERLLPVIHEHNRCVRVVCRMVDVARALGLPVVMTEQYPQGLGVTCRDIADRLDGVRPVAKTRFSACVDEVIQELKDLGRPNVIVAGIEAHVCVQLTVLDLLRVGFAPFVLGRGISSRHASDRDFAVHIMRQAGAVITSVESLAFEMLGTSDHESFKRILDIVK